MREFVTRPALRPALRSALSNTLKGVGGYSAEASALFARFTTPPDATRKGLINSLIVSLKTAGVWTKLDALYLTAAADSQAARQNWIADQFNLTAVNSPTFAADRGYTGDGSSSSLSTSFNATTATSPKFTQDSAQAAIFSRTDLANGAGNSNDFGQAASPVSWISRSSATVGLARVRANMSATANGANTGSYVGLVGWSRTAAAVWRAYKNGVDAGGGTDASTTLPNLQFQLLASFGGFGVNQLAAACFGAGLNATEYAALYSALNTYLVAVGAA